MSAMEKLLKGYDTKALAKRCDPVAYRAEVSRVLSSYQTLLTGRAALETITAFLDDTNFLLGGFDKDQQQGVIRAMFRTMRKELPAAAFESVCARFAPGMDRYFNHEGRSKDNLSQLRTRARFEIERIKAEGGFFTKVFRRDWRLAKEMYRFADEKLVAMFYAENPHLAPAPVVVVQQQAPAQHVIGLPSGQGW